MKPARPGRGPTPHGGGDPARRVRRSGRRHVDPFLGRLRPGRCDHHGGPKYAERDRGRARSRAPGGEEFRVERVIELRRQAEPSIRLDPEAKGRDPARCFRDDHRGRGSLDASRRRRGRGRIPEDRADHFADVSRARRAPRQRQDVRVPEARLRIYSPRGRTRWRPVPVKKPSTRSATRRSRAASCKSRTTT